MRREVLIGNAIISVIVILFLTSPVMAANHDSVAYYEIPLSEAVSPNNVENAVYAARLIDGTIVNSREIFSFNRVLGERTPEHGFVIGQISSRSKYPVYDYGGGICMTAGILHQAVKSSGMQVIERHNHVAPVGYLPSGEDAAVTWGVQDYRFRNNGEYPIKIKAGLNNQSLCVEIFKVYPMDPMQLLCIDDEPLKLKNQPVIINGTTYVPLDESYHAFASREFLSCDNQDCRYRDQGKFINDTEEIKLETTISNLSTLIINGEAFAPVRELAELFGFNVYWDNSIFKVNLIKQ